MSEQYGGGMGSSAEDSPVDSLDLEANFAYIIGERQKNWWLHCRADGAFI